MPVNLTVTLVVIQALNVGTPMDGRGTINTRTHTHTHIHQHTNADAHSLVENTDKLGPQSVEVWMRGGNGLEQGKCPISGERCVD